MKNSSKDFENDLQGLDQQKKELLKNLEENTKVGLDLRKQLRDLHVTRVTAAKKITTAQLEEYENTKQKDAADKLKKVKEEPVVTKQKVKLPHRNNIK